MALRHHSLVAWQRADDLFIKVHRLALQSFPACERFELGSQLRRAAYSVPANIVEGFARRYPRARLHFLNIAEGSGRCTPPERRRHFIIAQGSVYECAAILDILRLRKIAQPSRCLNARNYAVRIAQMLGKLAR